MDGPSLLLLASFGLLQIMTDLCRRRTRLVSRAVLVLGLLSLGYFFGSLEETVKMSQSEAVTRAVPTSSWRVNQSIILFLTPETFYADPLWYLGKELSNPFASRRCAYSRCVISSDPSLVEQASLVVFQGPYSGQCCSRNGDSVACTIGNGSVEIHFAIPKAKPGRAVVYFQMEAPARAEQKCLEPLDDAVNYTWSYRLDSDIYYPYGRIERLPNGSQKLDDYGQRSYAKNVLWYVSNCGGTALASSRYEYALALGRYIDVDIYGQCSGRSDRCPRYDGSSAAESCRRNHRSSFRFYFAFENSHCNEYVTEKFFDALKYGNVPIVRGLPKHKYQAVAPPNSFIHADDFDSPASLARHLRWLAASGDRYAKYHEWRRAYGVQSGTKDVCKLCELATLRPPRTVRVSRWWSKESNCLP